jgi:hypothetical protein
MLKLLLPVLGVASVILAGPFSLARAATEISPEEAREIAEEAYVYGFPMVMAYKTMHAYTLDEASPEFKGQFNQLACEARVFTPEDKAVVTPNSDTPYCMIWMDIGREPLILKVPELEPERYYSFQFIDLYTHNYAYVGTLSTGNGAGNILLAGPGWQGETPEGISKVFKSETNHNFSIARTQIFGPDDLERVEQIQSSYGLEPLSAYLGMDPAPPRDVPDFPEWVEGSQFDARIFTYLDFLLSLIEPNERELPLFARFAKIGLGTDEPFEMADLPPEVRMAVQDGAAAGFLSIEDFIARVVDDPLASAKIFGTREFLEASAAENYGLDHPYLMRAAAAHVGLYGNSAVEAIYPTFFTDANGGPLTGAENEYTITFAKDQLPPIKAFWSLTMYDGTTQLLVDNPLDRYLLNSTMTDQFVRQEDGSLVLYVQSRSPAQELESNWLPAPEGPFYLVMRLYGPEPAALEGDWTPPALQRRE